LIGLSSRTGTPEERALISEWTAVSASVIAYSEGGQSLATRCELLLAGCLDILEDGTTEFPSELQAAVQQYCLREGTKRETAAKLAQLMNECGAVARTEAMFEVFRAAERVSAFSQLPVLITGETGTGKELIAQAICRQDPQRRGKQFVPVNCGALDPELAGSELFGHRKGAFTGAVQNRLGLFRAAHHGILFLDEVGELSGALQARLLRVLQSGRVLGVGEDHEVEVDVRILAATNRDLPAMVRDGAFREDLYHRLNVTAIHIPPLRERREDIAPLVEHFLKRYGNGAEKAAPDFLYALERAHLPGNARQVENLVRHALVYREPGQPVRLRDLPAQLLDTLSENGQARRMPPQLENSFHTMTSLLEENGWNLGKSVEAAERMMIQAALSAANGNQTKAAHTLGITARSIYNKLRRA
jgi:DNA-binding NtrC family response regulator